MSQPSRPILRYHGGKWKLADWIISNFPNRGEYYRMRVKKFVRGGCDV